MKIAILSRDGTLYSCKRLREAAAKRGHQVEILDPMSCYMNIDPAASSIHYKGRKLPHFDAVIPRIGSAITYYGTAALRQFELLGSYPLNESVAITRARDKLRSLQLLARQGIDLPLTGIAHSPDDTSDLIAMVGEVIEAGKPVTMVNLDSDAIERTITFIPTAVRPLLVPHILCGELAIDLPSIAEKKAYIAKQLTEETWESELRLECPHKHYVNMTPAVAECRSKMYAELHGGKV